MRVGDTFDPLTISAATQNLLRYLLMTLHTLTSKSSHSKIIFSADPGEIPKDMKETRDQEAVELRSKWLVSSVSATVEGVGGMS